MCLCVCVCVCVFRCTNHWRGHTLHNQTSTICLPTQGTSSPLPPPPSLLFSAFTLWGIKSLFQSNSHPHATQSLRKTNNSATNWLETDYILILCFVFVISGYFSPFSVPSGGLFSLFFILNPTTNQQKASPASPSRRTWRGSCCPGSSCAASSVRPGTSPDFRLCSCAPAGISSGQPTWGDRQRAQTLN